MKSKQTSFKRVTLTLAEYRYEFIKFLKENNAFIPFVVNLSIGKNMTLTKIIKLYPTDNILACSFKWINALQGKRYWGLLSKKWRLHLDLRICLFSSVIYILNKGVIKNEDEYNILLAFVEEHFDTKRTDPYVKYFSKACRLIEKYEDIHYPIKFC